MRLPSRAEHRARWSRLHGGLDPSPLVSLWLALTYTLATPLARARVPADLITLLGAVAAAGAVWSATRTALVAGLLVLLSGLLDGLDGTVAVLRGTAQPWGALLDSVVDRVSDALLLVALYVAGAPAAACLAAGVVAYLLEYARARAAGLGVTDVEVLTVGERPTRVLVVGMFLVASGVRSDPAWTVIGAGVVVALGVVALAQLLVVLRRRLR